MHQQFGLPLASTIFSGSARQGRITSSPKENSVELGQKITPRWGDLALGMVTEATLMELFNGSLVRSSRVEFSTANAETPSPSPVLPPLRCRQRQTHTLGPSSTLAFAFTFLPKAPRSSLAVVLRCCAPTGRSRSIAVEGDAWQRAEKLRLGLPSFHLAVVARGVATRIIERLPEKLDQKLCTR